MPFINLMLMMSMKPYMFLTSISKLNQMIMALMILSVFMMILLKSISFSYSNYLEFNYMRNFLSMSILFMSLFFMMDTAFYMLILFEIPIIPMCMILMKFGNDNEKLESTMYMLVMNLFGSVPYMLVVSMMSHLLGTLSKFFLDSMMLVSIIYSLVCFIFMNMIFLLKLPILFFHFWLTKAHVSASGICSMILASVMLKMGAIGLINFCSLFIFMNLIKGWLTLMSLSLMMLPLIMARSFDLKYLVALSSIIHMSMIPSSVYMYTSEGGISFYCMVMGHGISSAMLFMYVSLFYEKSMNRCIDFIKSNESIDKIMTFMFIFMMLINFGVPPFINFFSELSMIYLLLKVSLFALAVISASLLFTNVMMMFIISKILLLKKNLLTECNFSLMLTYMSMFSLVILMQMFMMA